MKTISIFILSIFLICGSTAMAGVDGKDKKNDPSDSAMDLRMDKIARNVNLSFANSSEIKVINADNFGLDSLFPLDTKNAISRELTYPEFARNSEKPGVVRVSFTYDEEGYIHILNTNTGDEKLRDYIVSKLESMRLKKGNITVGQEYYAKFHFKLL